MSDLISIIVPCYNESESMEIFYGELVDVALSMEGTEFEVLFVDDGSTDTTLDVAKRLVQHDTRVRYISLSRNFGKESAMFAGLEHAKGNFVAFMDADLQDPPSLLKEMYDILKSGECDIVGTRRVTRKGEPPVRSFFARLFYKLFNKLTKLDLKGGTRDFRLMTRPVVDALLQMREYNRFTKGLFGWIGFETKWLEYENVERVAGVTKWSFWKLFLYSVEGFVAFSTTPLVFSILLGLIMLFGGVLTFVLSFALTWGSVGLWVAAFLFIGGVQFLCLGVLGLYMSRTYLETKSRPIYLVREHNLHDKP